MDVSRGREVFLKDGRERETSRSGEHLFPVRLHLFSLKDKCREAEGGRGKRNAKRVKAFNNKGRGRGSSYECVCACMIS